MDSSSPARYAMGDYRSRATNFDERTDERRRSAWARRILFENQYQNVAMARRTVLGGDPNPRYVRRFNDDASGTSVTRRRTHHYCRDGTVHIGTIHTSFYFLTQDFVPADSRTGILFHRYIPSPPSFFRRRNSLLLIPEWFSR